MLEVLDSARSGSYCATVKHQKLKINLRTLLISRYLSNTISAYGRKLLAELLEVTLDHQKLYTICKSLF